MKLPFEERKFSLVVKIPAQTDEKYGCKPSDRPTEKLVDYGIVNVNKPKGPTSHQVSEFVQRIFGITKAGHSGTLDPAVTGVLPVALGRATRIVQVLLSAGKEYVGTMRLHAPVEEYQLRKTVQEFIGKITQLPPVRSAVVRQLRERNVYYFDMLEVDGQNVLFKTGVQAGTYIRKLCHDIGRKLGTGAHMTQLVRTKAAMFSLDAAVTLHDLEDALHYWKQGNDKMLRKFILPVETGVQHMPKVYAHDSAVDAVCHGAMLNVPGIIQFDAPFDKEEDVAVMTLKGELVALGTAQMNTQELTTAKKGMAVKTKKVFMPPGTYPAYKLDKKENP
ncbi:MAG: RNA-guided pseudouridylation complex pseudouridine synthase subunit Cbf5 [Candidatus Aenigmarchaeota archaeon]|nr:RNA-guided pseudouridylation complex pseudouridine synthase subunit Cbf5 [Candidatus Aenigmarchaeota archaeon]